MERFKSAFSGCTFEKADNGRCYQIDNAMRGGEYLKEKAKRRISDRYYAFQKVLHEQMIQERGG